MREELEIKNQWKSFLTFFWIIFILKNVFKSAQMNATDSDAQISFFVLQLFMALLMAISMGYTAYKISGEKKDIAIGFLGFFWFAVIGIFIGFAAVQNIKNKKLKELKGHGAEESKPHSNFIGIKNKEGSYVSSKFIIIIIVVIAVVGFLSTLVVVMLNNTRIESKDAGKTSDIKQVQNSEANIQEQSTEWVKINSPDGKMSVTLPREYKLEENNAPGEIPTYSYIAYVNGNKNSSTAYIVKHENYENTFSNLNVNYLSVAQRKEFLNQLAKLLKNDLGEDMTNFSTKLGSIEEHNAIKFAGDLTSGAQHGKVGGFIILVGRSAYTLSAVYQDESILEFDRFLKSFSLLSEPNFKLQNFLDDSTLK